MKDSKNSSGNPIDRALNKLKDQKNQKAKKLLVGSPFESNFNINQEIKKNINTLFQQVNEEIDSILRLARSQAPKSEVLPPKAVKVEEVKKEELKKVVASDNESSQSVLPPPAFLPGYKCQNHDCQCSFCSEKNRSPQLIKHVCSSWNQQEEISESDDKLLSLSSRMFKGVDHGKYCPFCAHELISRNFHEKYTSPDYSFPTVVVPTRSENQAASILNERQVTLAISNPFADYDDLGARRSKPVKEFDPDSVVGTLTREINLIEENELNKESSACSPKSEAFEPSVDSYLESLDKLDLTKSPTAVDKSEPGEEKQGKCSAKDVEKVADFVEKKTNPVLNKKFFNFVARVEAITKSNKKTTTPCSSASSSASHKSVNLVDEITIPAPSLNFTKESVFNKTTNSVPTHEIAEHNHKIEDFFPNTERLVDTQSSSDSTLSPAESASPSVVCESTASCQTSVPAPTAVVTHTPTQKNDVQTATPRFNSSTLNSVEPTEEKVNDVVSAEILVSKDTAFSDSASVSTSTPVQSSQCDANKLPTSEKIVSTPVPSEEISTKDVFVNSLKTLNQHHVSPQPEFSNKCVVQDAALDFESTIKNVEHNKATSDSFSKTFVKHRDSVTAPQAESSVQHSTHNPTQNFESMFKVPVQNDVHVEEVSVKHDVFTTSSQSKTPVNVAREFGTVAQVSFQPVHSEVTHTDSLETSVKHDVPKTASQTPSKHTTHSKVPIFGSTFNTPVQNIVHAEASSVNSADAPVKQNVFETPFDHITHKSALGFKKVVQSAIQNPTHTGATPTGASKVSTQRYDSVASFSHASHKSELDFDSVVQKPIQNAEHSEIASTASPKVSIQHRDHITSSSQPKTLFKNVSRSTTLDFESLAQTSIQPTVDTKVAPIASSKTSVTPFQSKNPVNIAREFDTATRVSFQPVHTEVTLTDFPGVAAKQDVSETSSQPKTFFKGAKPELDFASSVKAPVQNIAHVDVSPADSSEISVKHDVFKTSSQPMPVKHFVHNQEPIFETISKSPVPNVVDAEAFSVNSTDIFVTSSESKTPIKNISHDSVLDFDSVVQVPVHSAANLETTLTDSPEAVVQHHDSATTSKSEFPIQCSINDTTPGYESIRATSVKPSETSVQHDIFAKPSQVVNSGSTLIQKTESTSTPTNDTPHVDSAVAPSSSQHVVHISKQSEISASVPNVEKSLAKPKFKPSLPKTFVQNVVVRADVKKNSEQPLVPAFVETYKSVEESVQEKASVPTPDSKQEHVTVESVASEKPINTFVDKNTSIEKVEEQSVKESHLEKLEAQLEKPQVEKHEKSLKEELVGKINQSIAEHADGLVQNVDVVKKSAEAHGDAKSSTNEAEVPLEKHVKEFNQAQEHIEQNQPAQAQQSSESQGLVEVAQNEEFGQVLNAALDDEELEALLTDADELMKEFEFNEAEEAEKIKKKKKWWKRR